MKLLQYLQISQAEMQEYIDSGMIDVSHHDEFPLTLFSYSRQAQHENLWPEPVRKCRGLIIRDSDDEIIARPFEKFFNIGTPQMDEAMKNMTGKGAVEESKIDLATFGEPDYLYEKMDGFMCTLYEWEGHEYIASKGSFHSPHAKWANATYNAMPGWKVWPLGFTPVFEGLSSSLRIVVNYGIREELVLIGLINIETGGEILGDELNYWAGVNGFQTPTRWPYKLAKANQMSLDPNIQNFEGYVAVWNRPEQTPFRLKIKYQDYLRLHRMVCGVSPKAIYEALVNGWTSELAEWTNESTPWFSKFVARWVRALEADYNALSNAAYLAFDEIKQRALDDATENSVIWTRKQWAEAFKAREYPEIESVLFGLLDGKDVSPIIWKRVKPMIKGSHPMVDAAKT